MGKKINVVNLNGFEATTPSEQTPNEAEGMSKIKEEVENNTPPTEPPTEQPTEPLNEQPLNEQPQTEQPRIEAKPKPKRKPPAKKKEEIKEEVRKEIEPTPPKEEVEVKPPDKKVKTVELVSCPDCKKEMSKKTLRYSHEKNCTGKPIVREEIPVKRRAPVKTSKPPAAVEQYIAIPEEIIQQEINKRVKEQKDARIKAKIEKIQRLAMNIA